MRDFERERDKEDTVHHDVADTVQRCQEGDDTDKTCHETPGSTGIKPAIKKHKQQYSMFKKIHKQIIDKAGERKKQKMYITYGMGAICRWVKVSKHGKATRTYKVTVKQSVRPQNL